MSESVDVKGFRAILPLGKARVIDRGPDFFKLAIGGSTTISINMDLYDIRDGDFLTLYTEVLLNVPHKQTS